ncbi:hypothetical protein CAPTEDRAFT_228333 [Capitella teleta]|uniref:Galectin n=1 Tax=Capitella teleta TaxID=283909 RepID=R7UWF8_CAPTE|nr:hypothetical protein CAPTEDRAFT_228333 [Capitella teleta]|eukprot:ELU10649.1 hypothetical protein CAPTEDRAFT_228333 [Capitella teleta]
MDYAAKSKLNTPGPIYANDAIVNPVIPFVAFLGQRFSIGEMILIEGYIPPNSTGFSIGFQHFHTRSKQPDELLRLNIILTEAGGHATRNACLDGIWGSEERGRGLGGLKKGQYFKILILVNRTSFKISFNGVHFCDFKHRRHFSVANQLSIRGSVEVDSISFQPPPRFASRCYDPSRSLLPKAADKSQFEDAHCRKLSQTEPVFPAKYGWDVPFYEYIEGGMPIGRLLYISGKAHTRSKGFVVNLRKRMSVPREKKDIALHMSVRLSNSVLAKETKSEVLLNSQQKAKWGPEVRVRQVPFKAGLHFDLVIQCDRSGFKLSVNNQHMAQFTHRFPDLESITDLDIRGDLSLIHVRVH